MSTRSGKRIHTSLLEDTAKTDQEPAVKSERKTRSKRVKENTDELSVSIFKNKKRNNYVSYPTDDELLGDTVTKKEEETKQNRALRKNALKEHNTVKNSDQLESQTDEKHLIRKSRRGKRVDNAEETENHENVPTEIAEVPKSKKSKKMKKVETVIGNPPSEEAPAKKSKKKKKKGKRSSSMIVEDVPLNDNPKTGIFNISNMSVDSFHSAADSSFKNENIDTVHQGNDTFEKTKETNNPPKTTRKTSKKNSHINTIDKNDVSINMSMEKNKENKTINKSTKKRKPGSEVTALDQCFVSVARDNLEKGLEDILNVATYSNGQLRRRNSNARDATFDKTIISTDVGLEKDVESNSKVSNMSTRQLKKRKSNVKEVNEESLPEKMLEDVDDAIHNDTGDKRLRRRNSVVKDVTFDKSNESIVKEVVDNVDIDFNISNMSNKHLKTRRSVVKDTTFDKSNATLTQEDSATEIDLNVSKNHSKVRKSLLKDSTFDKSNGSIVNGNNIEKDTQPDLNVSNISNKQLKRRKSNVKDSTFDKQDSVLNTTFEKETEKDKETVKDSTFNKSNNKHLDTTNEKDLELDTSSSKRKEKKSSVNTTYDKTDQADTTFEKYISTSFDAFKKGAMTRKSSIRDATFDKSDLSMANFTRDDFEKDKNIISSSATKRRSIRRTFDKNDTITENVVLNATYEKMAAENELRRKSPRLSKTPDIQTVLNTTFEKDNAEDGKENLISSSKSSLISSDNSSVADKSDISRISITSDDTLEHVENILNATPLLIESSIDESHISITKPVSPKPQTPLKREGTFTKDVPEMQTEIEAATPTKRKSIPTAGCTPYHVTKSSQKKSMLNVTRSLEKGVRATVDPAPRLTRVMFCSPVDNPVIFTQEKRKVIKSNLKGSNKSFVFEETSIARPARKRSYTQNDADDTRVKRTRLAEDLKQSVDRLSRPRTASATGKLAVVTPKKSATPSKPRSEGKPSRTKLPNFAAMHQKQFDKMESLDECQERRAKRAKQLLTPTAPAGLLERISPKNNTDSPKGKELAKPKEKTDTPTKKLPTLESLRPGFTRFGFKLNLDVNPFSIPSKTVEKPKEKPVEKPNGILPRQGVLPSLAGATSVRREVAKLTVMREKSFTDRRNVKRNENRTVIKGVRTNRRFELQMKMRNID